MNPDTTTERRLALEQRYAPWRPRTTAQLFDEVAAEYPERPFVLTDDRTYTYADMHRWALRLAAGLMAVGVRPGDHVAVDMANFADFIALKLAIARIGAVSVAVNYLLRHEELAYVLRQSDASVLITMDEFRGLDYLDCLDRIAPGWEDNGGGEALPRLRHVFVRAVTSDLPRAALRCPASRPPVPRSPTSRCSWSPAGSARGPSRTSCTRPGPRANPRGSCSFTMR